MPAVQTAQTCTTSFNEKNLNNCQLLHAYCKSAHQNLKKQPQHLSVSACTPEQLQNLHRSSERDRFCIDRSFTALFRARGCQKAVGIWPYDNVKEAIALILEPGHLICYCSSNFCCSTVCCFSRLTLGRTKFPAARSASLKRVQWAMRTWCGRGRRRCPCPELGRARPARRHSLCRLCWPQMHARMPELARTRRGACDPPSTGPDPFWTSPVITQRAHQSATKQILCSGTDANPKARLWAHHLMLNMASCGNEVRRPQTSCRKSAMPLRAGSANPMVLKNGITPSRGPKYTMCPAAQQCFFQNAQTFRHFWIGLGMTPFMRQAVLLHA